MNENSDADLKARMTQESAGLGLIYDCKAVDPHLSPSKDIPYNLVDYSQLTLNGVRITSNRSIEKGSQVGFMAYVRNTDEWKSYRAFVARSTPISDRADSFSHDLEFVWQDASISDETGSQPGNGSNLEFLMQTEIFESISSHALLHLINCLRRCTYPQDAQVYTQGEQGKSLFLIQDGICAIKVHKDNQTYPVSRLKKGDVFGELAVLTGEEHSEFAVAETDLTVWELRQEDFDQVTLKHPGLRIFLTELVTQRLESWSYTIDRSVGKYTIQHPIGTGGWGIVYSGYHRALSMPVAIKMLKHDMAMEPLFLETFRREAQIIARLNHQNIVQIFDIDEIYRTIFIIMEFLEGEQLRTTLQRCGSLSVPQTVNYLKQILGGLQYAHDQSIVHRDIKPENIFVMRDGRVKILDFGLAAPPGEEDLNLHGTLNYASPEQIEGEPEDARSDIYALGIMAYELLCGKRPYPEDDLSHLMDLHCKQAIPDPAEILPDLPETLHQFILKCCAIDPAQRYASAGEALEAIENLACKQQIQTGSDKRILTSVLMIYPEKNRQAIRRLLEKFSHEVEGLGSILNISESEDI
ncbi:MAG: protein kinase [Desulfobacterales bacterium]|nr:protein kinase [Desulfobacterales bacterium]